MTQRTLAYREAAPWRYLRSRSARIALPARAGPASGSSRRLASCVEISGSARNAATRAAAWNIARQGAMACRRAAHSPKQTGL